jgi:hypothetical protein
MRTAYLERITGLTNAGTAVYIKVPVVKPGQILLLTDISIYNGSGETVNYNPGVFLMGEFIGIGFGTSDADTLSSNQTFISAWVREGETFAVRVTGATKQGKVTLSVSGWLYSTDPQDPAAAG